MYIRPLEIQKDTVNIAVTASSQVLAINATPIGNRTIRLLVDGTDKVFWKLGTAATTVTTATGCPMLGNSVETFLLRNEITHIAVISTGTASTLYVSVSEGA